MNCIVIGTPVVSKGEGTSGCRECSPSQCLQVILGSKLIFFGEGDSRLFGLLPGLAAVRQTPAASPGVADMHVSSDLPGVGK